MKIRTMKQVESYWSAYWGEVAKFSANLLKGCMADPQKAINNPAATLAALKAYEEQPIHHCYWNNRFCIAIMCCLPPRYQREAAWCAVSNGINGYWEWITHSRYDIAAVLNYIGIKCESLHREGHLYYTLDGQIVEEVIKYFDLPTWRNPRYHKLDASEKEMWKKEAGELNRLYRYAPVL